MKKKAIGMMSGTSLDGVDITLCEIEGSGLKTKVTLLKGKTYSYQKNILNQIKKAINIETSTIDVICSLNVELAYEYVRIIRAFCEDIKLNIETVDFIASHGQTIFHINDHKELSPSSLQLGDGSVMATILGVDVVSNFRNADIAVGGTGAPLVSYADYCLCSNGTTRLLQNIGGIANVTKLSKSNSIEDIIAFDNGPGNMMIDAAMNKLFNQPYDSRGEVASKGMIITNLLEELLDDEYFIMKPPKSTGRERYGVQYTNEVLRKYKDFDSKDIITTLTHFTAKTIADSYAFINEQIDEVVVSGGGAHNTFLLQLIREYCGLNVTTSEEIGISVDYKEAMAFVILANETLQHKPSNVPSATGAIQSVVLGQISKG